MLIRREIQEIDPSNLESPNNDDANGNVISFQDIRLSAISIEKDVRDSDPEGFFDAVDQQGWLFGWARDQGRTDREVEVEVVVDGVPVGRFPAHEPRDDLARLGWGDCAFRILLPSDVRDGARHSVDVRFADTGRSLQESPKLVQLLPHALEGAVGAVGADLCVVGWARDHAGPDESVAVDVFVDGEPIGRFEAEDERADLITKGWRGCAFRVKLPEDLRDGLEHAVEVRFAADGEPLRNSPRMFLAPPAAAEALAAEEASGGSHLGMDATAMPAADVDPVSLDGVFDTIDDDGWIAGWARRSDGRPCRLDVLIDEAPIATVSVDQFRSDLSQKRLGDCAFWFRIPRIFNDGRKHTVTLRETETGLVLAGSPQGFCFHSGGAVGDTDRNLFPNAGLTAWPNGLVVTPKERFEEIVAGWFFDKRRGTAPEIAFMADKPVDIALGATEYAMKVAVRSSAEEGYMRLVVPLAIKPAALPRYRFSLGIRRSATSADTSLHVSEIFLATRSGTAVEKVSTIRRALKQKGTVRLSQLPLLQAGKTAPLDPDAQLCIVIDLRGTGELLIFSPVLGLGAPRAAGEDTARSGEFEDGNIRSQVRHLKLSPIWRADRAVAGQLGTAPVPALAAARKPKAVSVAVPFIQVVVPVYNAALDVETLLASVVRCTDTPFEMLVFDDGSRPYTAARVAAWERLDPRIRYVRNEENVGYTRNINIGLQSTVSDHVVLINSDTIVTPRWLEKMFAVMSLDERIGAVGPLSNAASWQSVPRTKADDGDWIVNSFDRSWTPDRLSLLLEDIHDGVAPEFPLLNGFCTMFRRSALEEIGYFDDAAFPRGYGEENDLCLRLGRAGWALRVATDTYVHHAKSKSFGHVNRKEISRAANQILRSKHPEVSFAAVEERMRSDPTIIRIRRELAGLLTVERTPSRCDAAHA